ncbi:MAG: Gfo/Idh/MocA family oxidoreductase [Candidatus Omnitrophica bacterium]|nr:Gfo/Idh/MocA family oxidoreductase [Candidatus Omnitrophota bacterium]
MKLHAPTAGLLIFQDFTWKRNPESSALADWLMGEKYVPDLRCILPHQLTFLKVFDIIQKVIIMKVAVIGIGKLGSIHLRIYKEINEIEKIYVVDTDPSRLALCPGIESFTDYRKLLGKVDLVSVAVPTIKHFEIAQFFLKNKIPVLVEKPITQKLSEAEKLIKTATVNKTILFVGHVERYNNAYLAIKETVKKPLFIECHRLSPYPNRSLDISVVLDLMIHDLDIILDLVRVDIKKVEAKGVKVLSNKEDIANARITFKNGCVANITASRISAKKERKIRIFLSHCYISLDFAEQHAEIYQKIKEQITRQALEIDKEEPLKKEILDFVGLVKNNTFDIADCVRAKNALKLALDIEKIMSKK